jgi:hypothetical protein
MIAAVTCDIIKSRQYKTAERKKVDDLIRQAFTETIELLPEAEADKLSFSIIQGDEFQFVIGNPALAYKFVVFYRVILALKELKPKFRAGIGIGDVAIDNDNSYKMDGSAFHYSRDAFRKFAKPKFRHRITSIISGNEDLDAQFEIIAMYNDFIEQRWSEKQIKSIYLYNITESLENAASKESITYQAMQQRISVSGYQQVESGFLIVQKLLNARL